MLIAKLNTASELLLPRTPLWPEVAFTNAFPYGNVLTVKLNTAPELLLPRTQFEARGSILQRISIGNVLRCPQKTELELTLPWTHFVTERSACERDWHSGTFYSHAESPNGLRCVSATTQLIVACSAHFRLCRHHENSRYE